MEIKSTPLPTANDAGQQTGTGVFLQNLANARLGTASGLPNNPTSSSTGISGYKKDAQGNYIDPTTGIKFYEVGGSGGQYSTDTGARFDPSNPLADWTYNPKTGNRVVNGKEIVSGAPSPQNTGSSDVAEAYKKETADYMSQIMTRDAEVQKTYKEMLDRQTAGAQRDYEGRVAEATKSFADQSGTLTAFQNRLGTIGTAYGNAEIVRANEAKQSFLNNLVAEKQSKIAELTEAYKINDYKRAGQLQQDIMNLRDKQTEFLQKERDNQRQEANDLIDNQQKQASIAKAWLEYANEAGWGNTKVVGNNLVSIDENGDPVIMPMPTQSDTTETKNYKAYAEAATARGEKAVDFDTWYDNQKAPASYREYLQAQKDGFNGTLIEYQQSKKGKFVMDAETLTFLADKYLVDGKPPSFGNSTSGATAKYQFWKTVAATGLAGNQTAVNQIVVSAQKSALTKLLPLMTANENAQRTTTKNLDMALELNEKYDRTQVPKLNNLKKWYDRTLSVGDAQANKEYPEFETAIYIASREYANIAAGSTLSVAGLTDAATEAADRLLNAAMNKEQFKNVVSVMKRDMENTINEQKATVENIRSDMAEAPYNTGFGGGTGSNSGPKPQVSDEVVGDLF